MFCTELAVGCCVTYGAVLLFVRLGLLSDCDEAV